jgi:enoyl-CoA hydratase
MSYILTEHKGKVALVTIQRPAQLNALNAAVIQELHETMVALDANPEVRAVVLTGSGEKSFVAGADIAEFASYTPEEGQALATRGQALLFDRIEQMSKPVVAAINGFALGGGLELALACHIRLASTNAKMGLPEVGLGVIPGYGGTQRLPRTVGPGRALQMIATAKMIDATTAERWGLVNTVHELPELIDQAVAMGNQIAKQSGTAIAHALEAVRTGWNNPEAGFEEEKRRFGACFQSPEFIEGTTAFLEKRPPVFS